MRPKKLSLVLAVTVALSSSGCSDDDTAEAARDDTLPRLLIDDYPRGEMDAIVSGVVTYDESTRCFRLDDDGYTAAVLWPVGSELLDDGDAVGVVVPEVGEVRVGDHVQGGGGYLPIENNQGETDGLEECVDSGANYAVLDRVSEVTRE